MESDVNELRMYEDLVASDGWKHLVAEEQAWWQAHLDPLLVAAASDADDVSALNKLRHVLGQKKAIDAFLARPHERIRKLRPAPEPIGPSSFRRGGI